MIKVDRNGNGGGLGKLDKRAPQGTQAATVILHGILGQLENQRQTGVFGGIDKCFSVIKKDHVKSRKANLAGGAIACKYSGISKHSDLLS